MKVAVLGSGVMGAGIAAHLANAGVPSFLLDIVPKDLKVGESRNKLALRAIDEVLPKLKPSPIFDKDVLKLITPGNFEDDFKKISEYDWIIEVVVEKLEIKQKVFSEVEKFRRRGSIVSSNTSGISLLSLTEGRSEDFQKNFLITHFFNPVRYMKLVEVITGPKTDPKQVKNIVDILENTLGKGVVFAKDTPSFIANRIGLYGLMNVIYKTLEGGWSVEAVDKITGPATGKPKSATFRTVDVVGLDTCVHVANYNYEMLLDDENRDFLKPPKILNEMMAKGWLGQKSGQGFYKKTKEEILSLDLKTLGYKSQEKVRFDSLGEARNIDDVGERIKFVVNHGDKAGQLAWEITRDNCLYAVNRLGEIADDIVNIDNAMKWGFNWDLGPFETIDAIGVKSFVERCQKEGTAIPKILQEVLKSGKNFYQEKNRVRSKKTHLVLKTKKDQGHVIQSNAGASLVDLGDGVICLEFHTKMNAIDNDIGDMINSAIDSVEGENSYQGIVISNDGQNFSVGANLMLLYMEAQQENWKGIENLVIGFQNMCMRLKYSKKPVVVAPFGLTLGGGCEITLGADFVRAYGETYIGLVEVGAGLIPGGGGNKNLLMNIEEMLREKGENFWFSPSDGGPFPKIQNALRHPFYIQTL